MDSLSNKLLPIVSLVAALGCNGCHKNTQTVTGPKSEFVVNINPEKTEHTQKVEHPAHPVGSVIEHTLTLLGGDLCIAEKEGKIRVTPFKISKDDLDEALNTNPVDGAAWNFSKKYKPDDLAKVDEVFKADTGHGLPFCHSLEVLRSGLEQLNISKVLRNQINDCLQESLPWSLEGPFYHSLENGLVNNGYRLPLSICIAHYGGDYAPAAVSFSEGMISITPSCFSTVAATGFGYPPNTTEPYSSYLQMEKEAVLKAKSCMESLLDKSEP